MRNGEIDHVVRTIELVVILPVGPESHTPRSELRSGSECVTEGEEQATTSQAKSFRSVTVSEARKELSLESGLGGLLA